MSVPNGGLSNFSAIITKSFGFTSRESLLLQVPSGFIAAVTTIAVSYWAQVKVSGASSYPVRQTSHGANLTGGVQSQRMLPIIGTVLPTIFGAILLISFAGDTVKYKGGLLFAIFIVTTYGSGLSILYSWSASNVAGGTKKGVFSTLCFACLDLADLNMIFSRHQCSHSQRLLRR